MNLYRDQKGNSLIQVLVSVGILGVVMAGVATMMFHQGRETKALSEVLASMDLQKTLLATFASGEVCHHILNNPTQHTFDSTSVSEANPQTIRVSRIPVSVNASAPSIVQVGAKASAYSNSLEVSDIRLLITGGSDDAYVGSWIVDFDSSKTVRRVKPLVVSTLLTVDRTTPTATRIVGCQESGQAQAAPTPPPPSGPKPGEGGYPCGEENRGFTAYMKPSGAFIPGKTQYKRVCCYIGSSMTGVSSNTVPAPHCN